SGFGRAHRRSDSNDGGKSGQCMLQHVASSLSIDLDFGCRSSPSRQHASRAFGDPRGGPATPLNSRFISASKSIELVSGPTGIELRLYAGARVAVAGVDLSGNHTISLPRLRLGAVITIARRVALLLHTVEDTSERPPAYGMIGESDAIDALRRRIHNVADLDVNVLIRGESGAGKEHVARAIWQASQRADGPFEARNMSGIPDSDLGLSALFGHVKGAFTGAVGRMRGLLERNHGGTVFLDEIGACGVQVQDRLLRVLQDGVVNPVGAEHGQHIDLRVIAATDADLEALVTSGRFRQPLLHRLAQYRIDVPPLVVRRDDIARLAVHFLRQTLAEIGEPGRLDPPSEGSGKPWFPAQLMAELVMHDWSGGNVRALANAVRRLVIDNRGRDTIDLKAAVRQLAPAPTHVITPSRNKSPGSTTPARPPRPPSQPAQPRDISREEFLAAYRRNDYSPAGTARELGRPKATVYSWMKQFGLKLVKDIPDGELIAAYEARDRNLTATAHDLEVSTRALHRRLRALGITVISE
ncbi:MAG: sigma 54-interacting transcriptional regulator, partial [Myxococcota bacterium]